MGYRVGFKGRDGQSGVIAEYETKREADARIISIAKAQKDMGAYHVTPAHETFGIARASWSDGSYIEVWRLAQIHT